MTLFGKLVSEGEAVTWVAGLALLHVAYAREVLLQDRTQSRLYASMPAAARSRLPDRPSTPRAVGFGSVAFLQAFLRYVLTDTPEDPVEVTALKTTLRASSRRERWFASLSFAGLLALGIDLWSR
jgi:hypothetical protein